MRKLHEPCGARLVADVAHALLRAVSRLISTPALLFDTVCESCARTGRREESRRGTQECVRYVGDHLPHSGSSSFLDIRGLKSQLTWVDCLNFELPCFDVTPDGNRFLVFEPIGSPPP